MAERIYIADKPTLDQVRDTLDQVNTILTQLNTLIDTNLDAKVGSRQANWGATSTHAGRIDAAISSRASQATVNTINTNVSNINSKINAGVGIKSVQRGTAIIDDPASSLSVVVPISAVNVSKSFVLLNGTGVFHANQFISFAVYLKAFTSTSITIASQRYGQQSNIGHEISWQVVEFY